MTISASKVEWFLILVLILLLPVSMLITATKDKYQNNLIGEQKDLLSLYKEQETLMTTIIREQQMDMRVMAYHQAVAQLEQEYPLEYRNGIDAAAWETMLSDRTDAILRESRTFQHEDPSGVVQR